MCCRVRWGWLAAPLSVRRSRGQHCRVQGRAEEEEALLRDGVERGGESLSRRLCPLTVVGAMTLVQ